MAAQQILIMAQPTYKGTSMENVTCEIWDSTEARFFECSFPVIAGAAASVTLLVLLGHLLQPLWWRMRPQWTKRFVREEHPKLVNGNANSILHFKTSWPLVSLLGCSVTGLVSTALSAFFPHQSLVNLLLAASWATGIVLVALKRPRKFSPSLLLCFGCIFIASSIILVDKPGPLKHSNASQVAGAATALVAVCILFTAPMRDPFMPHDQIGKAGGEPTRDLRSPEDNLTLWQWISVSWISRLLDRAGKRQLNDEDVWSLSFEFQHRQLHDNFRQLRGSVLRRLLIANAVDMVIVTVVMVIFQLAVLASPVLLRELLQTWENPHSPRHATIKYAVLQLVARLIAGNAGVLGLWFARRCYERARGEMITMLYEKTLARKIITTQEKAEAASDEENPEAELVNGKTSPVKAMAWMFKRYFQRVMTTVYHPFRLLSHRLGVSKIQQEAKKPASMGKILNLMRNDVYEVAQRFWEADQLVSVPLGIVWSVVLVWKLIGPSCLLGVLTLVIAQVGSFIIVKIMLYWERVRRVATDGRLQATSQTIESIRHLRWYGWQQTWIDRVMNERQRELNLKIVSNCWGILLGALTQFAGGAFPVAAFAAYTALAHQPLRIEIAFPALQLFEMLEGYLNSLPGLVRVWLNAMVAIGRIEDFMKEPDKAEDEKKKSSAGGELALKNADFSWPGTTSPILKNLNLSFPYGLTVICGQVGAGKTALLQALLGELDLKQGELVNSEGIIAYCGQTPWLESMSIRDNILFAAPYEDERYKKVLDTCALTVDLSAFQHGDLSNVGENGIGLSGGQKARVALARAFYSQANTLLLDDPISALDHNTAESIVQKAFGGNLLEGRRVILVTHRTEICSHLSSQVVEISNNTAQLISQEAAKSKGIQASSTTKNEEHQEELPDEKTKEEQEAAAVPDKFIEDEHRASGGVRAAVYWQYIRAGKVKWWFFQGLALAAYRVIDVARSWLLKQWGEAYDKGGDSGHYLFQHLPNPASNVKPWLLTLFLNSVAWIIFFTASRIIMMIITYSIGRRMFHDAILRVTNTVFRYYDVTPVGRLMNRLTSDIGVVDGNIAELFHLSLFQFIAWLTAIVIIASVTPTFLIFSFVATIAFVVVFRRFLPTSQNLRRLEMVSLSPLMTNFGALLDGLMTVRAYSAQGRFQARNITVVDAFQKMDHFYWSVQEWLMFRYDVLSATSTFLLTLLALYTNLTAGLTAFVLTSAGTFVRSTHALCRVYGQIEMDFTSVERVVELLHLEQEPKGHSLPPAAWPSTKGDIVFEDVTVKYAAHLDPALSNVSFRIPGGSNAAVIGRTGSGKSTLAVSLLATVLATSGRILIDGIDIATVDPDVLRKRVTFLAQDPLLFEGNIRSNLDPLNDHSDDECAAALDRVCGSDSLSTHTVASSSRAGPATSQHQSTWTLSTRVESGGRNFSQGQRQLVGLARAILRRSALIILDEATASIDVETSMRIQAVVREEMKESTVITIAHRVEAVQGVDMVVRLKGGTVLEVQERGGVSDG